MFGLLVTESKKEIDYYFFITAYIRSVYEKSLKYSTPTLIPENKKNLKALALKRLNNLERIYNRVVEVRNTINTARKLAILDKEDEGDKDKGIRYRL